MGRLITNSVKPVVRVNVAQSNYRAILNLAQRVHDAMTISSAFYVAPTPTLAALQTDINGLETDLSALGTKTNKGGRAALDQVKNSSFTLFNDLTQLAFYVQTLINASESATLQALLLSRSGFAAKSKKSRVPINQFIKGTRQSNSKKFPQTLRRIKWKKPLGNFSGFRPKAYNIYGTSADGAATQFLTTTTATNYIVPETMQIPGGGIVNIANVTIRPVTASGEGNAFTIPVK